MIFMGGINGISNQDNSSISEAFKMKELALSLGVKESDILIDDKSNNKFENIENCTPKISIDEQNEISITLQVVVKDDVIIKDLANSLQNKVKEEMKKTSDLDVKNVNIKIINMSKKTNENKE